jgi:hypothetical protein
MGALAPSPWDRDAAAIMGSTTHSLPGVSSLTCSIGAYVRKL